MDPNLSLANKLALWLDLMLVQSIPIDSRRAIPWLLWAVWKNMNAVIFASTQESLGMQVQHAVEEAKYGMRLTTLLTL